MCTFLHLKRAVMWWWVCIWSPLNTNPSHLSPCAFLKFVNVWTPSKTRGWGGGAITANRVSNHFIKVGLHISGTGILCGIMWSSFEKQVENDWRLKQLMNTYTERSGATHVCSGQLLREFGEKGTSEGLHRSRICSVNKCECVSDISVKYNFQPLVLWQIFNPFDYTLRTHVVQTTTAYKPTNRAVANTADPEVRSSVFFSKKVHSLTRSLHQIKNFTQGF